MVPRDELREHDQEALPVSSIELGPVAATTARTSSPHSCHRSAGRTVGVYEAIRSVTARWFVVGVLSMHASVPTHVDGATQPAPPERGWLRLSATRALSPSIPHCTDAVGATKGRPWPNVCQRRRYGVSGNRCSLRAREREPLPADLQRRAETFEPVSLDEAAWSTVRPLFLAVIASTSVRGADAFSKRCIALAAFLAWAAAEGLELSVPTVMRFEVIDTYTRSLSSRNAGSRRSHLRSLTRDANPGGVPPPGFSYEHNTVKPPYSDEEMAAIRRVGLTQPTPAQRRSVCAVVGLARGAGLDSQDFRHLGSRHVDDQDDDGIWVDVQGSRQRLVPVRKNWEDLVRAGLKASDQEIW